MSVGQLERAVDVVTANLDFRRGGDGDYLEWLCERAADPRGPRDHGPADVLLLQEAKDLHLDRLLPKGWTALQDRTDAGTAGSAIAVRDEAIDVRDFHLVPGVQPFLAGRRVRMEPRHIAVGHLTHRATGTPFAGVSTHLAPPRFKALQDPHERNLRRVVHHHRNVIVGVDGNQPHERLADAIGLDSYGRPRSIIALLTDLQVTGLEVRDWGEDQSHTDHPAAAGTVHLRRMK